MSFLTIQLWNEISLICFTFRLGWIFESNSRLDRIGGGQSITGHKLDPTRSDESLQVRRDFECLALSRVSPRATSRFAGPVIQKYLPGGHLLEAFTTIISTAFPLYFVVIRVIPNTCWLDRLEGKSADRIYYRRRSCSRARGGFLLSFRRSFPPSNQMRRKFSTFVVVLGFAISVVGQAVAACKPPEGIWGIPVGIYYPISHFCRSTQKLGVQKLRPTY